MPETLKGFSSLLAFSIEMVLLVALVLSGYRLVAGPGWLKISIAVLLPAALIVLWSIWAAPKSATRLEVPARIFFKLALFFIGSLLLYKAGYPKGAVWLGISSAISLTLECFLKQ